MYSAQNSSVQLNDDLDKLMKAGYEYVEGTLVPQPISRPQFTLTELRNAIPSHCFERSMLKSFGYLALDLVIVSSLLYCAYVLFEQQWLPFHCRLVGYLIYWFLQGSFLFGVWVIGEFHLKSFEFWHDPFLNSIYSSRGRAWSVLRKWFSQRYGRINSTFNVISAIS